MKKRVISAILMIMLFIPVVILGGYPFLIVCSILAVLGLKELLDLKKNVPNIVKYIEKASINFTNFSRRSFCLYKNEAVSEREIS